MLGPLLYTADLYNCLSNFTLHPYADDCQLIFWFSHYNINIAVQNIYRDFDNISLVSHSHGLVLNETKTDLLVFGKNSKQMNNHVFSIRMIMLSFPIVAVKV